MQQTQNQIVLDRSHPTPIYHQIKRQFSDLIVQRKLKPGERLPSIPQTARQLGVNIRTVSQAYQELADTGLVKIISKKGTFVAESEQKDSKHRVILILGINPLGLENETSVYAAGVYRGICLEARELKYECICPWPVKDAVKAQQDIGAAGCIIYSANLKIVDQIEELSKAEIKGVTVGGPCRYYPTVHADDCQGINLLMDHLFDLSHRQIAYVSTPLDGNTMHCRFDTYLKKMAERDLHVHPSWIHMTKDTTLKDVAEREAIFSKLFQSSDPPTAIVLPSAYLALGIMQMLYQHEMNIPRQVSVCGYDDIPALAFASPAMTTIRQPVEQIGRTAVRNLIAMMEGKPVENANLPVELIVRNSTGPAPGTTRK